MLPDGRSGDHGRHDQYAGEGGVREDGPLDGAEPGSKRGVGKWFSGRTEGSKTGASPKESPSQGRTGGPGRTGQPHRGQPVLDVKVESEVTAWKRIGLGLLIVAVLCGAVAVCAVIVVVQVLPLKQVVPFVLTIDQRENAVYTLEPLERTTSSWDNVTENLVCQYVVARNEVIPNEGFMVSRWGQNGVVQLLSSKRVFTKFKEASFDMLEYYEQNGFHREITLLSPPSLLDKFADGKRYYRIDFRESVYDPISKKVRHTQNWTATLGVLFGSQDVLKGNERFANPIGISVFQYSEAQLANAGLASAKGDVDEIIKCGGRTGA